MALYKKIKCPVCNEEFKDGDDVVTCPICGTPHHRECYKSIGKCANADKHGTDFAFKKEPQSDIDININESVFKQALEEAVAPIKPRIIEKCNEYEAKRAEMLDDVTVGDVTDFVRVHADKFIPKFKKNKRLSWNWSAFFFGPYYLFFRKMYKQGFLFLLINFVCQLFVKTAFLAQEIALTNKFSQIMNALGTNDAQTYAEAFQASNEALQGFYASTEFKAAIPAIIVSFAVSLVVSIVIALLANSFYRKKAIDSVKYIDKKIESINAGGGSVVPSAYGELDEKHARKMLIGNFGGISFSAPLFAYLILDLLNLLISYLIG